MLKLYHNGGCISTLDVLDSRIMKTIWKKTGLALGLLIGVLMGCCHNAWAEEDAWNPPPIFIKAINPGYVIDDKSNVGEMIELVRMNSDEPFLLAGATVGYTNSSGNYSILFEFPENSWMTGETLLLRLASSPESELAAVNYSKTLAFKGEVSLNLDGEKIDGVCWTGKSGCAREFKSAAPTTLVRNMSTGEFEHTDNYLPQYDALAYRVDIDDESEELVGRCAGLSFSEILSYYETSQHEQFIELYNNKAEQLLLDGCMIRYKNKSYRLSGIIKPDDYMLYIPVEFGLTKNPTNVNLLELVDIDGKILDKLEYPNGQRKGASYAMVGYGTDGEEIWRVTFAPSPGEPNSYQQFRSCEEGKVINEATGNCVKAVKLSEKICPEGQFLNILTGRCNKYKTVSEKTCKEGYTLNPLTGRCRKIVENTGATYSLEPEEFEEKSSFTALYAVLGAVGVGLIYVGYEFRHELAKLWRKVWRRFR